MLPARFCVCVTLIGVTRTASCLPLGACVARRSLYLYVTAMLRDSPVLPCPLPCSALRDLVAPCADRLPRSATRIPVLPLAVRCVG